MWDRQDGQPRVLALRKYDQFSPNLRAILNKIVMEAHSVPRFNGREYQNNTVVDFGERILNRCTSGKL
ncbi:hypothetical protein D3C87_1879270 [compost metagenome]